MKKMVMAKIALVALAIVGCSYPSYPGEIRETYETSNHAFRVRVNRHAEENRGVLEGAYYVFQSAPVGSDQWRDIMVFRHDDPVPIPRNQIRFVNENTGYVFMGWMYAVTTDKGAAWSVWDARQDLPKYYECCNYRLVGDVKIDVDGTGAMRLNLIPGRSGAVPELRTSDFGRHWRAQ
jgi:hypothetical protein